MKHALHASSLRHRASPRRLMEALQRTIASERELLAHPRFEIGAAHVMVDARSQLRRMERRQFQH
jgi:hypothetical protein